MLRTKAQQRTAGTKADSDKMLKLTMSSPNIAKPHVMRY